MKKRILVIDDEEILTKTFSRLLQKQGYEVAVATRGEDALRLAESQAFDLALCDVRMPGLSGVETVRQIQGRRVGRSQTPIPVIFLTGFADKMLEMQAQQLKPAAYVYKPFDALQLLELIQQNLAKA